LITADTGWYYVILLVLSLASRRLSSSGNWFQLAILKPLKASSLNLTVYGGNS